MVNNKKINLNYLTNFFKKLDYWIFIPYVILSVLGIIMVYSASSNIGGSPTTYLFKQTIFFILGFFLLLLVYKINLTKLAKLSIICIPLFIIALSLLKGFGKTINGAAGWIPLGPVNIQPSEFTKVFIIIFLSRVMTLLRKDKKFSSSQTLIYILSLIIIISLIFIQPDLGGASINFLILTAIVFTCGMNWKRAFKYFIGLISIIFFIIFGGIVSYNHGMFKNSYQIKRLIAFSQPFNHMHDVGQQLVNSYYAISNGGIFGVGLGNSIQKKGYLPEPNTDFIMSIISEELGLIIVIFILLLLAVMVGRILLIGIRNGNIFYSLICYGFATYLTVQSFFNVGGVIGMLPITGVTFPFISYGGSSIFALSICMGMVLKISKVSREHDFYRGE